VNIKERKRKIIPDKLRNKQANQTNGKKKQQKEKVKERKTKTNTNKRKRTSESDKR